MKYRSARSGRILIGAICFGIVSCSFVYFERAHAAGSPNVVIRTIQAIGVASTGTGSYEMIEIYNPTAAAVDVTGWSLVYTSASGSTTTKMVVIKPSAPSERVMLDAGEGEVMMSDVSASEMTDRTGLLTFASGMNHAEGSLSLRSGDGGVVDKVGWGAETPASLSEGESAPAMKAATVLRRTGPDTDDNRRDFALVDQSSLIGLMTYGNLREETDVCLNIPQFQDAAPEGLVRENGNCVEEFVPVNLRLSELLPNPDGIDTGNEFLEIYNDSDHDVAMDDYYLKLGEKIYHFPVGAVIPATSYKAWSDSELGVVFANTTGVAIDLFATNDQLMDRIPAYQNAAADQAWAWLDSAWAYTNRPTRDAVNLGSLLPGSDDDLSESADGTICKTGYYFYEPTGRCRKLTTLATPTPCKDGQYRSEETGRCRTLALSGGTLQPCKEGQYRSEETNRCRSLVSAVASSLKPCRDDQFRNPETGRCKKIASADDAPQPCKEGWERNPDTNRCRKIRDATVPVAAFPVEQVAATGQAAAMWWAIGGVGTSAFAYAGWEWRREMSRGVQRLTGRFFRKK